MAIQSLCRTGSAAQLSDAPFRLLADHLPALCWIANPDGEIVWFNRRWYDYTGMTEERAARDGWTTVHDPAVLPEVRKSWRTAIAEGQAGEMVFPLRGADGVFRPFLTRAEPVHDEQGRTICWLGTHTEITNQQEAERNQRFLVMLGDRLRDLTDPLAILAAAGEALARHLHIPRVGYAEVDAAEERLTATGRGWSDDTLPGGPGEYRLADFGPAIAPALLSGQTCVIGNVATDPRSAPQLETYLKLGIRALVCVPLIKRGHLGALLYVHSAVPRAWREGEVRLVEEVAERTWATLERARAEAAQRESDERLRHALEGALLGTVQWDLSTLRGQWSKRTCEIFGIECGDDITVDQFRSLVHPDDRRTVLKAIGKAIEDDDGYVVDYRIIRPDGQQRWVVSRSRVQRNADGQAVATNGFVIDITDRKAAEERLRESEARLRAIVEATPECVKIVGSDGMLLHINAAGLRMIEADPDSDVGSVNVAELVAPEHRKQWQVNHRRVCAGESVNWEFDIIGRNGTRRRMETHAVPLPAADGSLQQLAVTRDVTARRAAEERLRESEALLAAFMKHAPIGMYLKDAAGRYLLLNPEMAKVFGRPVEEVIGRTASELFGSEEARFIADYDREILETGQPRAVEEFLPGHDAYAWSMVVRFPVSLEGERPTRIGGFDIDISDRKRAEAELERSREALYQSEKLTALGSLLAGVSHELNNPLSIVVTLSMLLEEQLQGSPQAERAQKIRRAADRCAKIVQTFLAMARQKRPERARVDANDLVRGALELASYGLRTTDITVRTSLAPDLPPLWADADQLHQVLVNLFVNAQHALQDKASDRVLSIRTRAGGRAGMITIEVADNGPGIPPEVRRRIFEPFFTTKPQGAGTGLGLSFSLGIVEAHGGRMRLCDVAGGACFLIELPTAVGADTPVDARDDGIRTATGQGQALVIDDEPDVAEALAELLMLEGFRVDIAKSGLEAQALLAVHRYDLLLSDLRMPDLDGPALYAWIERERPELCARTAFVTGDTLGPAAAHFLACAGRPLLEKPFGPESLRRLLAELSDRSLPDASVSKPFARV